MKSHLALSFCCTLSLLFCNVVSAENKATTPLIDMVDLGKQTMLAKGCVECHSVARADDSFKTGPNLYGIFQLRPKRHEVIDAANKNTISLIADFRYLQSSLARPTRHLSIQTRGDNRGKAYAPVMPAYTKAILSSQEKRALYDYFLTLNPDDTAGPAKRLVKKGKAPAYNPDTAPESINARDTTLVYRAYVNNGTSARGIHVGQANAQNYSFDPATLAIDSIWTGRFLDTRGDLKGRGGMQSSIGVEAQAWSKNYTGILRPLTTAYSPKRAFSAALTNSNPTDMLTNTESFAKQLESLTGKVTGYTTGDQPTISYTLDGNQVNLTFVIDTDGTLNASLTGKLKQALTLTFPPGLLKNIQVNAGTIDLEKGAWTLTDLKSPATWQATPVAAKQGQDKGELLPQITSSPFSWAPSHNSGQDVIGGYSISQAQGPEYTSGTSPLFEPLAIEFEPDGTPVIGSRAAGIWKIKDNQWQPYALGAYDVLGLKILPDGDLIVAQKPELTRISDRDNDGTADHFQTLTDQFRFVGNYHAYTHGPAIDKAGNIHFNLNLQHVAMNLYKIPRGSDIKHSSYNADGKFMGSSGGYRGWSMQFTSTGKTIPFANGLRSPAGLEFSPDDELYYTENQGEYVATSKLFILKKDKFYGHPSGLVDIAGQTPATLDKRRQELVNSRQLPSVLFPHNRVANSPGHPLWDTTKGKFGPFAGQIFVGDQSLSNIHRIYLETINGIEQGCIMPFANGLPSGPMRLSFSPDGDMWVGQTGRGWASRGGNLSALQKITWQESNSQAIHRIEVRSDGFEIFFNQMVAAADQASYGKTSILSWYYENSSTYGSAEHGQQQHRITSETWSNDSKSVKLTIKDFAENQLRKTLSASPRVFRISLKGTAFGDKHSDFQSTAYYTLIAVPK